MPKQDLPESNPASAVLLDGRSPGDYSEFLRVLDAREQDWYRRLPTASRRREFALGRALSKAIAARIENLDTASVSIGISDAGAPFFVDSELHLSISHCSGWVAAAVSSGKVGIDIQTAVPEIPARVMGPRERKWVDSLPAADREMSARWLWTIKEARGKLAGTGLRFPVPEVPVPLEEQGADGSVHWRLFRSEEVLGTLAVGRAELLSSSIERLSMLELAGQISGTPATQLSGGDTTAQLAPPTATRTTPGYPRRDAP